MNNINSFIKKNQPEITPNNGIIISVGKFLESKQILNCQLDEIVIKSLLDKLSTKNIRYNTVDYRIYRYMDMEYRIDGDGEYNITNKVMDIDNVEIDNIGFRLKFINSEKSNLETFPCKLQYHDEFNYSSIIIDFNNLLEIHVITEEREDGKKITKLDICILKQNIYEDKLIKAVGDIIKIIKELL